MVRAFRHRNFRLYFAGQSISLIGTWVQQIALGWTIYQLTHSSFLLGLVSFAGQLPLFIVTPFAGVLVDRDISTKPSLKTLGYCRFVKRSSILPLSSLPVGSSLRDDLAPFSRSARRRLFVLSASG